MRLQKIQKNETYDGQRLKIEENLESLNNVLSRRHKFYVHFIPTKFLREFNGNFTVPIKNSSNFAQQQQSPFIFKTLFDIVAGA